MTPCSLVNYFGVTYNVHLRGRRWNQYVPTKCWYPPTKLHDTITQKTAIWIVTDVKTWNSGNLLFESVFSWYTGFEVLTVVTIKITTFWELAASSLADLSGRFVVTSVTTNQTTWRHIPKNSKPFLLDSCWSVQCKYKYAVCIIAGFYETNQI
jgi:hypothetical protein